MSYPESTFEPDTQYPAPSYDASHNTRKTVHNNYPTKNFANRPDADTTPLLSAEQTAPSHAPYANCRSCSIKMMPFAKFCHSCGVPTVEVLAPECSVYDPGEHTEAASNVGVVCVLGKTLSNPCIVPPRITSTSILGGSVVDLTRSKFIYPNTKIIVTTVLGKFRLVVPRGVNVVVNGATVLGRFKNAPGVSNAIEPGRPTITVVGASVLAGARVVVDSKSPPLRVVDRPPPPQY